MKNKVVIITGASSGIGEGCVQEFSKKGCKLVLASRNIDKLNQIAEQLNIKDYLCFKCDVTSEDDCQNLIESAFNKYGKIDILINNAGISMRANFEDVDLSVIKKVMDVNFYGMVYCTKYALKHLIASKGTVVGISSISGSVGLPGRTGYTASKFAMNGFLDCLRVENMKNNLHVLTVAPGFVASNIRSVALDKDGEYQSESPRNESKMMTPKTLAKKIIKAIIRKNNYLTLSFEGKMSIIIKKIAPNFLNKILYSYFKKESKSTLK